jgi:hypothetical protein
MCSIFKVHIQEESSLLQHVHFFIGKKTAKYWIWHKVLSLNHYITRLEKFWRPNELWKKENKLTKFHIMFNHLWFYALLEGRGHAYSNCISCIRHKKMLPHCHHGSATDPPCFHYRLQYHIFMAKFWLCAIICHLPLLTLAIEQKQLRIFLNQEKQMA